MNRQRGRERELLYPNRNFKYTILFTIATGLRIEHKYNRTSNTLFEHGTNDDQVC